MKLITSPRPEDDLSSFGTLLRFAALVYVDEDEGEAGAPFGPHHLDGDVAFAPDRDAANAAFDAWVESLKEAEGQFLEEMEEEGVVALIDTPRGLMILAGSTMMGFDGPDVETLLPGAPSFMGMPHISWERILFDVFKIQEE